MSAVVVGVDIAKAKFDVARLAEGKYRHKKYDNTPQGFALFVAWLAGCGGEAPFVCMEATGAYSLPLADYLPGWTSWGGANKFAPATSIKQWDPPPDSDCRKLRCFAMQLRSSPVSTWLGV